MSLNSLNKISSLQGERESNYNFSAGPSRIPTEVLVKIQEELFSYRDNPFFIGEISHRSSFFTELIARCRDKFRRLLNIPENYEILFCHGGATLQFAMIPMNFQLPAKRAGYVMTGEWSRKAYKQNFHSDKAFIVASSEEDNFSYIPSVELNEELAYLHITDNNTIYGTEYNKIPTCSVVVSDMTSNILTKKVDFGKYAVIYGGSQKNCGIPGFAFVVIRKDFLERAEAKQKTLPPVFNYYLYWKDDSMYNTPNTFGIYVLELLLDWTIEKGGVAYFEKLSLQKSKLVYDYLDSTDFYINKVKKEYRSRMNIPFFLKDKKLDAKFLQDAETNKLLFLKGHKLNGGMRVSAYNAMPLKGILSLIDFMKYFEKKHG